MYIHSTQVHGRPMETVQHRKVLPEGVHQKIRAVFRYEGPGSRLFFIKKPFFFFQKAFFFSKKKTISNIRAVFSPAPAPKAYVCAPEKPFRGSFERALDRVKEAAFREASSSVSACVRGSRMMKLQWSQARIQLYILCMYCIFNCIDYVCISTYIYMYVCTEMKLQWSQARIQQYILCIY